MNTTRDKTNEAQLAACVAPEDIHCGDYLAILSRIEEYPSFFWCCDVNSIEPHETVRVRYHDSRSGIPMKVKAICLPFVFVELPNKSHLSVDVRMHQFARLQPEYAKTVVKGLRGNA